MQNIIVGRYVDRMDMDGQRGDYLGWIEPEDRSWLLFVRADHSVEMYLDRDPETGAVL